MDIIFGQEKAVPFLNRWEMPAGPQSIDFEILREKVQTAIGGNWDLKTFKGVFFEIVRIINDPRSGAKELARVISMDPGLSARILRVVNSPYYALTHKVNDLAQAVALLGFESLKQIAVSITVFETFAPGSKHYLTRLWRNSLGVAKVAETFAKEKGRLPGEAYTMGLLHHIGKILLISGAEKKYYETLTYARNHGVSDVAAEEEVLGVNHAEIGYVAATHWELPPLAAQVIRQHHIEYVGNILSEEQYLCQLILLSDAICSHLGLGAVEEPVVVRGSQIVERVPSDLYENAGFSKDALMGVVGKVANLLNEIDELMQLLQH